MTAQLLDGRATAADIRRELPADATRRQVEDIVDELNADPACTGYIVQLPLPRHLDAGAVLERMEVPLAGARVCVVGRGITVGRPIGLLLTRRSENATVTLCHTGSAARQRRRGRREERERRMNMTAPEHPPYQYLSEGGDVR